MTDRYLACKYATHYNKLGSDQYVRIHLIHSSSCPKEVHNAEHLYEQGSWAYFVEKYEAEEYAKHVYKSARVEIRYCKKCFKH